jgi:hypothetical protein
MKRVHQKRRRRRQIAQPKITRTDSAYWESVLASHNLGLGRGDMLADNPVGALAAEADNSARNRKPKHWMASHWSTPSCGCNIFTARPHAFGSNLVRITFYKSRANLIYVGGSTDLQRIESQISRVEAGRISAPGHSPQWAEPAGKLFSMNYRRMLSVPRSN